MLSKLKKYFYNAVVILTIGSSANAYAQNGLPVIRATSKTVTIRDGLHLRKDYWAIMPERKPDYYYLEIPEKGNQVTFITDQDSITFQTTFGQHYDFIILLNGKDSCYTRISANYKDINRYSQKVPQRHPDTIPFTIGDTRKVYIEAKLNGSAVRNIQLDLGAGGTVINEVAIKKVKINFDSKVTLRNTDGINEVDAASKNILEIGNLVWDSVSVAVARNMKPHEDLIIGNYLFKGKILEINYDKKILVIHDSLPNELSAYTTHDFILDYGVIPHIKVTLDGNGKKLTGWSMFDTGARTSIASNNHLTTPYQIVCELAGMIRLGDKISPKLTIDQYRFSGFEFKTREMNGPGLNLILGNDLLKRFNLIFDNKTGRLYMQPNSLANSPYRKTNLYFLVRIAVGVIVLLAVLIIIWRSWKINKRKRSKTKGKSN